MAFLNWQFVPTSPKPLKKTLPQYFFKYLAHFYCNLLSIIFNQTSPIYMKISSRGYFYKVNLRYYCVFYLFIL